jgi:hypothetical protein
VSDSHKFMIAHILFVLVLILQKLTQMHSFELL